ncbi:MULTISPECIES: response regulator transcription factor [Sphingomonas]|jgi:two-component system, OmpR family, response regulator|uniref:response regulator transcription factor n=1 Tax=Sphingomonas TaxID=13687 RepID=UPI00158585E3|nr:MULTISPECIES: response regulator transcription factor [Sphingomonas]MBB4048760.1 DNA-binding response OmpR family regulator [Sphingomonas zeae]MDK8186093.1 response regulator transcription factor [Sphingomonas zeae]MDK8215401.1 response regulator transcription factor [Sphingomonas sp. UMB7805-LC452B]
MSLHLLLVEDDATYAHGLAADLIGLGHRVEHVFDGRLALAAIDREQYDAVILDRMMPRLDGLSVVEMLRASGITVPIVMLTALSMASDKVDGLEAGADDYVVKPVDPHELIARVQAVIRGRRWTASESDTIRAGDIVVSPTSFRAWRAGQPITLANLELKLLAELARHAGEVLTRAMLIERVWGYDFEPETNIVDVYIRRLRMKLTEQGGADPIETVRGIGYSLKP